MTRGCVDTSVSTDSNDPHTAPQQRVLAVTTHTALCMIAALWVAVDLHIFDVSSIHHICYPH